MKTFFLVLGLSLSLFANADVAEVNARQVTCEELKESLHNYGTLIVRSRLWRIPATNTVTTKPVNCGIFYQNLPFRVTTKDIRNCRAGYTCAPIERASSFP